MNAAKTGSKGLAFEERLRIYFLKAGYFVVRGIPFRLNDEDITDVDLWLYEKPAASARRRTIVDVKYKKTPKSAERAIWTKGLKEALKVDVAIVSTPDNRESVKRLAKQMGILVLDGADVDERLASDSDTVTRISSEEFSELVRKADVSKKNRQFRDHFNLATSSLLTGFGIQSANACLKSATFFADICAIEDVGSSAYEAARRCLFGVASLVAISLDYAISETAFRSQSDRVKFLIDGIRYGETNEFDSLASVRIALGLARQYAENGNAVAKAIERGFIEDAKKIPAEIIAEYVSKISSEKLFRSAQELEAAAFASESKSFDDLSVDAKSFLGVLLDFAGIPREKIADKKSTVPAKGAGPLFQRG